MENKTTTQTTRTKQGNPRRTKNYRVGARIYLPTELYLSHGEDDFNGGLCKIIETGEEGGWKWVTVKENPGKRYSLDHVAKNQRKWKKEYGKSKGKRTPDYSLDSNCWACPGDIVDGKEINYYIP